MADPIKVVAVRDGQPLVFPWRFWWQGNEFYAASQTVLNAVGVKASFHSRGKWQLRVSSAVKSLTSNFVLDNVWIHALHVHFVVPEGALRPLTGTSGEPTHLEIPLGRTLVLDYCVSAEGVAADFPRPPIAIDQELGHGRLRDGRAILVTARYPLLTADDLIAAGQTLKQAKLTLNAPDTPESHFGEVHWHGSTAEHGNYVGVVPLLWSNYSFQGNAGGA